MGNNIINEMQDTPSMVLNFPDVIQCGNGQMFLFFFTWIDVSSIYHYRYIGVGGAQVDVTFHQNGAYHSNICSFNCFGYIIGCKGKTVQQLYREDRAFNFVT